MCQILNTEAVIKDHLPTMIAHELKLHAKTSNYTTGRGRGTSIIELYNYVPLDEV